MGGSHARSSYNEQGLRGGAKPRAALFFLRLQHGFDFGGQRLERFHEGCGGSIFFQLQYAHGEIQQGHGHVFLVALIGIAGFIALQGFVDTLGCGAEGFFLASQNIDGINLLAYHELDNQSLVLVVHSLRY